MLPDVDVGLVDDYAAVINEERFLECRLNRLHVYGGWPPLGKTVHTACSARSITTASKLKYTQGSHSPSTSPPLDEAMGGRARKIDPFEKSGVTRNVSLRLLSRYLR